ncbi:MAG: hypothetical protein IKD80_02935 [Selenomonadaceae bacterium]|nr:hypothetical protein [Selenomonadaceae bacterium]
MDYSVYIIQDRGKTNVQLFQKLAGDTDFWKGHMKSAVQNLANNIVGANILDQYATTDVLGNNGIAIRGDMIKSVSIKSELAKKDMFVNGTIRVDKFLLTTITVKGNLFAPSLMEFGSEAVKNKDMAKVAAWAALPPVPAPTQDNNGEYKGDISDLTDTKEKDAFKLTPSIQQGYGDDYKKFYYRRVLVTVYSDTDTQFRAVLHDKVFVSSYEEVFDDKDGNGKFTLVMQCIGASAFDVFIAGPTYAARAIAVTDQISSTAQKITKGVSKGAKTVDHVLGTDYSKKVDSVTDKVNSGFETADSFRGDGDINLDNINDQINKQGEEWHPTEKDAAIKKATEYQSAYDSLTPAEQAALKNIPGFDKMSYDDKMEYIDKLKYKDAYEALTKEQQDALEKVDGFNDMSLADKTKKIKDMFAPPAPPAPDKVKEMQDTIKQAADYKAAYDALTPDQRITLKNVPGFDDMGLADKLAYIKTLTDKKDDKKK